MIREYKLWPGAKDNPIYCPDCGALVADILSHDEFHVEHDKLTDRFLAPKSEAVVTPVERVDVILFKPSGKFYTEESWRIPETTIGPYDMKRSKDFRRIGGGPVLIPAQEPWGFPHLFPAEEGAQEK